MATERVKVNIDALGTVHKKNGKYYVEIAEDISVFEGKKGNYVDVIRWENDSPDQYGQTSSYQISKPKDADGPKRYIGNGTPLKGSNPGNTNNAPVGANVEGDDDDLPF